MIDELRIYEYNITVGIEFQQVLGKGVIIW